MDLARELGQRLGVLVDLVPFDGAGKAGAWDVAFVALDPARAAEIAQSTPYVVIDGAYLVREDSPIRSTAEVDRRGNRIVVAGKSAYDLFLTRNIKHAQIVRTSTSSAVVGVLLKGKYEIAAGVKQQLEADAKRTAGVRLLDGRFMVINQAIASQRGKEAGARYVREFVEEMKASGFIARALERHQVQGATVALAGDAR